MKVEKISLEKLNPAKYNPRVELQKEDERYQRIKASIQEFGLVDPLIVNSKTMTIVGGHQRYNVLKDLEIKEADCVLLELTEKKAELID